MSRAARLRRAACRLPLLGHAACAAAVLAAAPAAAQDTCRLALQLGLDVSASVDQAEYRIQVEGLLEAVRDVEVP